MFRRYILFANLIPLAGMLALILLFVPAEEQFFLIFTAFIVSVGWAALIAVLSGFFSIPVMVRRLFRRRGTKTDLGMKG